MNKIRKIAGWCWETKERIVLAVMVILLGYRVYSLVYTPENNDPNRMPIKPGDQYQGDVLTPPLIPPPYDMDPVTRLIRNPPFNYTTPRGGTDTRGPGAEDAGEIRVLRIVEGADGRYKARITTGASKKLILEGEKFESYQLMTIDPDTGCCEIYSEILSKLIEVCIE
ncbi:MAG: hypothetical protein VCD00_00115 [Candidatus Hydrogenedentota bacterium]